MVTDPRPDAAQPPGRLAATDAPRADETVDAVGLFCPVPIIRTAARVRRMETGKVLELRADDPVTRIDLPNWCRGAGHRFLGWRTGEGDELHLYLQVARPIAEEERWRSA